MKSKLLLSLIFVMYSLPSLAIPVFNNPVNLGSNVNYAGAISSGAELSADGLTLIWHSNRPGNQGNMDLWMSTRSTTSGTWGMATNLGATINSAFDDRAPTLSSDGLTLIFNSNRNGNSDLFMSTRNSITDAWSSPATILGLNSPFDEGGAHLSNDGLRIYFQSDRGGSGAADIFMAQRASTSDAWGSVSNLGSVVNSSGFDMQPSISADELSLYFHHSPSGDIFVSQRNSIFDAWGTPQALGANINTGVFEASPFITADGSALYFSRDVAGGGRDIFIASSVSVSEPSTLLLLSIGLVGLFVSRIKIRKA